MRDYAELVKALRFAFEEQDCGECALAGTDRCTVGQTCRFKDAADAIEELLSALPRRISAEERLPEPRTVVLLYSHEGTFVGYMHDDKRFTVYASSYPERPTHWMPLPEAPKEVE